MGGQPPVPSVCPRAAENLNKTVPRYQIRSSIRSLRCNWPLFRPIGARDILWRPHQKAVRRRFKVAPPAMRWNNCVH